MKVLRILGSLFCCFLLCLGFALVMVKDIMGYMVQEQIVQLSTQVLVNEVLNTNLSNYVEVPKGYQLKVQDLQEEIAQDENVKELSQDIMGAILDENQNIDHLDQKIEDILKTYGPQVVEATGVDLPQEQVNQVINETLANVDVQEILQEHVDQIHEHVPKSMTNFPYAMIGYGMMLASIIGMMLCTRSPWRWLGYVGGIGICGGGGLMVTTKMLTLVLPSIMFEDSIFGYMYDKIYQYGMWFFIIAVLCLILYYVIRSINHQKAQAE